MVLEHEHEQTADAHEKIIADGLATLLNGFESIRLEKGRGPMSDQDAALIAEYAADLGEAFEERGLDADWGATTLSMMSGVGCAGREARLMKDAVRRFIIGGRVGRDYKWGSDEIDAVMVARMWELPDWDFFDQSERAETDDIYLNMCESVGIQNLGNDWIECLMAFVGEGVPAEDFLMTMRDAIKHIGEIGRILPAGEERDGAVHAYLCDRIRPPRGMELIVIKVATALSERPVGIKVGGEKKFEEWKRLLSAVAAGERGIAMLGADISPSEADWMRNLIDGSGGTVDACAVAIWLEIRDELRARAGSERALELLDMASPMDFVDETGEFSVWIDDAAVVADEFWLAWGAAIRAALGRIIDVGPVVRILDGSMRGRGD